MPVVFYIPNRRCHPNINVSTLTSYPKSVRIVQQIALSLQYASRKSVVSVFFSQLLT